MLRTHGTEPDAYLSNGLSAVLPDSHSFRSGQTTLVDVGGAGWRNFLQFKTNIIDASKTRVLSFINIVGSGMKGGPAEQDPNDMDARLTSMRIRTRRRACSWQAKARSTRATSSASRGQQSSPSAGRSSTA